MAPIDNPCCAPSTSDATSSPDLKGEPGPSRNDKPRSGATPTSPRIACDLRVFTPPELTHHGNQFEELVIGRATSVRELADGYAIQFPGDPSLFAALAAWIANEQRCCPFFTFELRLEPQGGAIWMSMLGPEGAKAILASQVGRIPSVPVVA